MSPFGGNMILQKISVSGMTTFPRDQRVKDRSVLLFYMLCIYVIIFSNILPENALWLTIMHKNNLNFVINDNSLSALLTNIHILSVVDVKTF